MNPGAARLLRGLGIGTAVVAWAVVAHLGSAGTGDPDLAVAVALAPLAAVAIVLLWRVHRPLLLVAGCAAGAGLAATLWPALRHNVALLYYLQHLGTNLALAALFGRTLLAGREALVSQFARLAHGGAISPLKRRYTRRVTVAWTAFFVVNAAVSTGLFLWAPAAVWSTYANLLTMPLLVAMFAVEHAVRVRVLPPAERSSVADTVRGYRAAMRARARPVAGQP